MKKLLALVLCLAMATVLLAGCGQRDVARVEGELTIFMMDARGGGQDFDVPVFNAAYEATGIRLRNVLAIGGSGTQEEALNRIIASRNLPDIIQISAFTRDEFFRHGIDGAFMPLNDMIQQYAPNIAAFLAEREDVRRFITAPDGNIYFIPYVPDGDVSMVRFIRQDWLDEAGLDMPTTTEEYEAALRAFLAADSTRIPYFNRFGHPHSLFPLWNAYMGYLVDDNGRVQFGEIQPEFRTALINMARWYEDGLIDRQIYTRGGGARDVLLEENRGGSTHDWVGSTANFNDRLADEIPGINFIPMAPPNGWEPNYRGLGTAGTQGWAITTQAHDPIAAMRYFDFWFSEEGRILANFGVEGVSFDWVDGVPQLNDSILNGDRAPNVMLNDVGAQLAFGFHQDFEYERQWLNPIALAGIEMYMQNNYIRVMFPLHSISLTPEEEAEYTRISVPLNMYRDAMIKDWIEGNRDVEAIWDEYIAEMERLGVNRLVEIMQAAYERYLAQ